MYSYHQKFKKITLYTEKKVFSNCDYNCIVK